MHSNIRLLSRRTPQYREGETKLWDIGGDAFDSMEGVDVLEIANLSRWARDGRMKILSSKDFLLCFAFLIIKPQFLAFCSILLMDVCKFDDML